MKSKTPANQAKSGRGHLSLVKSGREPKPLPQPGGTNQRPPLSAPSGSTGTTSQGAPSSRPDPLVEAVDRILTRMETVLAKLRT